MEGLLRDLRLLPYFDTVVSSAVVGYRKPNPVIFNLACEQMGMRAESSVHVGDRPHADGDGAAAAGIRAVIVDRHDAEKDCGYECVTALTEDVYKRQARKPMMAGNWKMNNTIAEAVVLTQEISNQYDKETWGEDVDIVICPP